MDGPSHQGTFSANCRIGSLHPEDSAMSTALAGLDLAKSVFQVHGVDLHYKLMVTKLLHRDAGLAFFANLSVCVVRMEASAGPLPGIKPPLGAQPDQGLAQDGARDCEAPGEFVLRRQVRAFRPGSGPQQVQKLVIDFIAKHERSFPITSQAD